MNEPRDIFTDTFANATVADFQTTTTAASEAINTYPNFATFCDYGVATLRVKALSGSERPTAVLGNPALLRVFTSLGEETVEQFVQRLHQEARTMKATLLHVNFLTQVGAHKVVVASEDDDFELAIDSEDATAVELVDGILWRAEYREGSQHEIRHGIMYVGEDNRLVEVPGDAPQRIPLLDLILDI